MKIALYNVDSKLPNLALMKISTFYKNNNHQVEWYNYKNQYDKVYGSKIFRFTRCRDIPNLILGGTGISLEKKLPQQIDDLDPDYSLYPEFKNSIGFVTRGCIRKCHFCFVPEKEGKIYEYRNIKDIYRGGNLILFDNNILALPEKFKEVLEFCDKKKIKVDFNQGLDCRLVNKDIADLIIKYKRYIRPEIRFAFDDLSYYESVKKCILLLGNRRFFWYVYVDNNFESALERLLILKRLKQRAYVMRDESIRGIKKFNYLAHWSNCLGAMRKFDIVDEINYYNNRHYFDKLK